MAGYSYLEHLAHFLHVSFDDSVEHLLEDLLVGELFVVPDLGGEFAFVIELADVRVIDLIVVGLAVVDVDDEVVAVDERVGELVLDLVHVAVQLGGLVLAVRLSEVEFVVGLVAVDQ